MIEVAGLTKTYGAVQAVNDLSFAVRPGRVTGFLGPNGAGKSTTMRMIGGTLNRTGGTMEVAGLDPDTHGPEVRATLGVVPQQDIGHGVGLDPPQSFRRVHLGGVIVCVEPV